MSTDSKTDNKCSHCGALSAGRTQFASGFTESFACGSVNHSDGFDQSQACRSIEQTTKLAQETAPVEQHAAAILVADAPAPKLSLEQEVALWSSAAEVASKAALKAAEGVSIAGHADGAVKGRKAAEASRLSLKRVRTPIEAERKRLKAPIVALGKLVDDEAKRLIAPLQEREDELDAECTAYDAEQLRITNEARAAEAQRIQSRVELVVSLGGTPDVGTIGEIPDEEFEALVAGLRTEKERKDAEREALFERTTARIARLDTVDAHMPLTWTETVTDAEFEAQLTILGTAFRLKQAEEAELEDEKKRLEREKVDLAKQREELDRDRAKLKADQDKIDDDAKAEQKRKVDEEETNARGLGRMRVEQLDIIYAGWCEMPLAELGRLNITEMSELIAQCRTAKADADREDQAEKDRLAALRPDREKIRAWVLKVREALPELPDIADAGLRAEAEACHLDTLNRLQLLLTETTENDA